MTLEFVAGVGERIPDDLVCESASSLGAGFVVPSPVLDDGPAALALPAVRPLLEHVGRGRDGGSIHAATLVGTTDRSSRADERSADQGGTDG